MFLLLLFFIARIVLKRKPFSRVVQEIRGKLLQSCSKIYKLVSQSRLVIVIFHAYHDAFTYFSKGVFFFFFFFFCLFVFLFVFFCFFFFRYGYHDKVESSMRVNFGYFFKTKLCNTYNKVDIE